MVIKYFPDGILYFISEYSNSPSPSSNVLSTPPNAFSLNVSNEPISEIQSPPLMSILNPSGRCRTRWHRPPELRLWCACWALWWRFSPCCRCYLQRRAGKSRKAVQAHIADLLAFSQTSPLFTVTTLAPFMALPS